MLGCVQDVLAPSITRRHQAAQAPRRRRGRCRGRGLLRGAAAFTSAARKRGARGRAAQCRRLVERAPRGPARRHPGRPPRAAAPWSRTTAICSRATAAMPSAPPNVAARQRHHRVIYELGLMPPLCLDRPSVAYHAPARSSTASSSAPSRARCSIRPASPCSKSPRPYLLRLGRNLQLLQPELSNQLRERKIKNIASVQPDVIATGNIGCMTQLRRGARPWCIRLSCSTGRPAALHLRRSARSRIAATRSRLCRDGERGPPGRLRQPLNVAGSRTMG